MSMYFSTTQARDELVIVNGVGTLRFRALPKEF